MRNHVLTAAQAGMMAAALAGCAALGGGWMEPVLPAKGELFSVGRNPYFVLEPGYQLVLESKEKDQLVITVLHETKVVDGVETRVVEERETGGGGGGKLVEVSWNYFAIGQASGDLYYFGEDVDTYTNGQVTGHGGSWLAGVNGARAGLMLPGKPAVGMRFYQEQAPKVAMDRSEVVSVTETLKTGAGSFAGCLKTAESSALESGVGNKVYAPGVGLLTDGEFALVKYGRK